MSGKTILITGGASGLGKIEAVRFAQMGNTVIVWDINPANMASMTELAEREKLSITVMKCNAADRADVYACAKDVENKFGSLDILINNAGVVSGKTLLETTDEQIERTINVNTMALFWTTKAFLPAMMKKGTGHLVNIASAAGLIGVKGLVDYSASKFAAVGFSESMRMELKSTHPGIAVTTVCPFFINTGMFDGVKTRFPLLLPILEPEQAASRIIKGIIRRKTLVTMPALVGTIAFLRIFPTAVLDTIAGFLGISRSMDHFTGRK